MPIIKENALKRILERNKMESKYTNIKILKKTLQTIRKIKEIEKIPMLHLVDEMARKRLEKNNKKKVDLCQPIVYT